MKNVLERDNFILIVLRVLYVWICGWTIAAFLKPIEGMPWIIEQYPILAFIVLLGLTQMIVLVDVLIRKKRIELLSAIYFGLAVGVLLAYLMVSAIQPVLDGVVSKYSASLIKMAIFVSIPYISISFLIQTKNDFRFIIPYVEFSRELKGNRPLLIDSSALIDGRIADLIDTNVVDSQLIVPQFVLREVQEIADSSDKNRRTRGRRGLEVLNRIQNNPHVEVTVKDTGESNGRHTSVDERLVDLAKQTGGRVVTSDFNLNKVAGLQGVDVINLNDIANALKPRYLPGERLSLRILKEGETAGQGVGYLDDGTMVVCEHAQHLIGQEVDLTVTSVLQSSAGRMIFGRQAHAGRT